MKKTLMYVCAALFLPVLFVSCYPEEAEYAGELDIAMTNYDKEADFSRIHTLVMPDSVVYISERQSNSKITRRFDKQILALVKNNLANYGYTLLNSEELQNQTEPDAVVTVSAFTDSYFIYGGGYSWFDYWGWYPWNWFDWYNPGMSPYYSWYPVGSYQTGSVCIEILDVKKADKETGRIPVIWNGIVNGILAGSEKYISSRLETNINQCFTQSPYLKH